MESFSMINHHFLAPTVRSQFQVDFYRLMHQECRPWGAARPVCKRAENPRGIVPSFIEVPYHCIYGNNLENLLLACWHRTIPLSSILSHMSAACCYMASACSLLRLAYWFKARTTVLWSLQSQE